MICGSAPRIFRLTSATGPVGVLGFGEGQSLKAARRWHMEAKRAERRSEEAPTALDGRTSLELRTVAGPAP